MQNNTLKDKNLPAFHYSEDLVRLQNILANDRAAIWNIERGYQILALQERLESSEAEKAEKLKLKTLAHNQEKIPSCAYKQSQHKMCVNKPEDPVAIPPPPPPGFLATSGLCCRCCTTYRNTSADCIPQPPDELDINAIIREFRKETKIDVDYEHDLSGGINDVPLSAKERKFSSDVTQKLLQTSYILFNILAEEVCFNDKLVKELCLRYVQSSRIKKRMSYTDRF